VSAHKSQLKHVITSQPFYAGIPLHPQFPWEYLEYTNNGINLKLAYRWLASVEDEKDGNDKIECPSSSTGSPGIMMEIISWAIYSI
jgi:hypothetical protein